MGLTNHFKKIFGLSSEKFDFFKLLEDMTHFQNTSIEIYHQTVEVEGRYQNQQIKIKDLGNEHLMLLQNESEFFYFKNKTQVFALSLDLECKTALKNFLRQVMTSGLEKMKERLTKIEVSTPELSLATEQKNLKWLELTTDFSLKAFDDTAKNPDLLLQGIIIFQERNNGFLMRIKCFNIDYLFEVDGENQYVVTVFDHKNGTGEPLLKLDHGFKTLLRPSFNCAIKMVEKLGKILTQNGQPLT
ncbi:MAG: hypothetical protein ACOYL6_05885 [Bacteriovoracaceae bacterium]